MSASQQPEDLAALFLTFKDVRSQVHLSCLVPETGLPGPKGMPLSPRWGRCASGRGDLLPQIKTTITRICGHTPYIQHTRRFHRFMSEEDAQPARTRWLCSPCLLVEPS